MRTIFVLADGDLRVAISEYVEKKTGRKPRLFIGTVGEDGKVVAPATTGLRTPFAVEVE